jgi:hypothetical protein
MNKRGDLTGVIFLIVSIFAFAVFLLIVGYIVPEITTPLAEQIGTSEDINRSLNVSSNIAKETLPTIWLIIFGGLLLGLFITSYFIDAHPIFIPVFVLLLIIAIVISIPLSNTYEELSENAILSGAATEQGMIGFILIKLPFVTLIVGLLSLLVTFAKVGGGGSSLA